MESDGHGPANSADEAVGSELQRQFAADLPNRIRRKCEAEQLQFIPCKHFVEPSSEVYELFIDGRFYGCISLCQSVIEAVVRHVWASAVGDLGNSFSSRFLTNLSKLVKRRLLDEALVERIKTVWARRNDYHHLNECIKDDLGRLEQLARENITVLADLEHVVFAYNVVDGQLVLTHPEYWDTVGAEVQIYVRG